MTKSNLYKVYAAIALVTAAIIGCLFYFKYTATHPSTDNAYVKANNITISSQVNGKVMNVKVCNFSRVKQGQVLFTIDKRPYQLAVLKAESNFNDVENNYSVLASQLKASQAQVESEKAKLDYLEKHLAQVKKTNNSANTNFSKDTILQLTDNVISTKASIRSALANTEALEKQLKDRSKSNLAETELNQAKLALKHCEVTSPVDGIVNRLNLQPGENVTIASPLFTIVDTNQYWILANFKETKLKQMEKGQKVQITLDASPQQKYDGRVVGLSPATGVIGSLLQPENATGNWIKVTQRVPVKISFDGRPSGLIDGQSAKVMIDINSHG